MNPMQKYPHITESFACTRKMLAFMFFLPTNSLISSVQHKTIEINNFISVTKQSNPICAYICIFVKVYYVRPFLYFFKQIISWKNTIKFFRISKFAKGWGGIKNLIVFQYQLLQFLFLFYFLNQLLQFLFLLINFLTN